MGQHRPFPFHFFNIYDSCTGQTGCWSTESSLAEIQVRSIEASFAFDFIRDYDIAVMRLTSLSHQVPSVIPTDTCCFLVMHKYVWCVYACVCLCSSSCDVYIISVTCDEPLNTLISDQQTSRKRMKFLSTSIYPAIRVNSRASHTRIRNAPEICALIWNVSLCGVLCKNYVCAKEIVRGISWVRGYCGDSCNNRISICNWTDSASPFHYTYIHNRLVKGQGGPELKWNTSPGLWLFKHFHRTTSPPPCRVLQLQWTYHAVFQCRIRNWRVS